MRSMVARSLVWGAFFICCGLIVSSKPSGAANCALYARAETGVALFGSAGGWWDEADGRYQRGRAPEVGAILVFKRTSRIPSGHVAIVTKLVSANEILVDHANWYRGRVNHGMSVIDTSPGHDWTSVAVVDLGSGKPGRDYPTYGFIYPGTGPRETLEARNDSRFDTYVADSWKSLDAGDRPTLLRVAFTSVPPSTRGHRHRSGAAAQSRARPRQAGVSGQAPSGVIDLDQPAAD
jgi:surface antigen